ncbi:HK97 family phage prohead protease [Mycoplasma sp. Z331B]|uniref:HK97 family phage prohead protease n=1 Tax=Mycoplasma sp. Z331B TaxID=3398775 RepID=UPI003A8C43D2
MEKNKYVYVNSALNAVVKRDANQAPEQSQERTIELTIELDSWSPQYKLYDDKQYREKIDLNCFDFETPIEQLELNSYLDHKISIEHLLASTKNKTMEVKKDGSKIIATLKVNESDSLSRKTADLIQNGVITSNSFIFQPIETEYKQYKNEEIVNNLVLEVIHKRGKLISIDPVYEGFYPQDKCRAYDKNNNFIAVEEYMENIEKQTQQEEQVTQEVNTVAEETITKQEQEFNQRANNILEDINNRLNNLVSEFEKRAAKAQEVEAEPETEAEEIIQAQPQPQENTITRAVLETLNTKGENVDLKEIKNKVKRNKKLTSEELDAIYRANAQNLSEADKKQVELIAAQSDVVLENLNTRALDGTTNLKGLAVVETLTEAGILTDIATVFPELTDFARRVPLSGLDKLSTRVYVADRKDVTTIAEAAESIEFGGSTFAVTLAPERRSVKVAQNNALTLKEQLLSAQVQNATDAILESVRKGLYADIFKHAGTAFNAESYTGGATSEAKRLTNDTNKITFADVDKVATEIRAQYGENILSNYFIVTHPDVYAELKRSLINDTQSALIKDLYDIKNDTFKGAKIIVTDKYPEKEWAKGKKPVLFLPKDQVMVYGLSVVAQDDPYSGLSRGIHYTIVGTRGQVKLVDPFVYTRFLEVK